MNDLVLVLTGAGISAESGIPTFRGPEGYWRVGSTNYRPEELATFSAFSRMPETIWAWYLYRRAHCRAAQPNAAHMALVALEDALGDRFLLVTQNVDGLHRRAGQSAKRMYEVHGNIDLMRCAGECGVGLVPVPEDLGSYDKDATALRKEDSEKLRCKRCGSRTRPHVLWFDESYDEEHFRYESALHAVQTASRVLLVGTTLQTTLPLRIAMTAARRGIPVDRVDPIDDPFEASGIDAQGSFHREPATVAVPRLVETLYAGA